MMGVCISGLANTRHIKGTESVTFLMNCCFLSPPAVCVHFDSGNTPLDFFLKSRIGKCE